MSLHPAYPIGGCDVSYWQTSINFDTLLDRDIWFIIARASVGTLADTRYQQHKSGAINSNLPYGAYHYWMPDYSIAANTDALITAQPTRPPMGVWIDLEGKNFVVTKQALSEHIYNCLQVLDEYFGTKTGLYTRANWWDYWIDSDYYELIDAASRPLWIAQYFYQFQVAPTDIPISWPEGNILIWQYSTEQGPYAGQASEFGITGTASLDIDAWLKSEEQFKQFTGAIIVPPPEELPMQVRTKTVANVRNAPDLTAASDVGNFDVGKVMNVIAEVGEFYKVEIYVAESVVEPVVIPPPPTVPEYYVAHDFLTTELPNGKILPAKGIIRSVAPNPEVFWLNEKPVILTEAWQWFIFEMNKPYITAEYHRKYLNEDANYEKWYRQNLGYNVAWANGTGFNEPGDPRRDYVNGLDLTAKYPNLDKCRVCGGAILHGTESNGILTVEVLDGSKPPPSWESVKDKYWLRFPALIVDVNGSVFNFPYCGGNIVWMPVVGIPPVTVPLNNNIPDKPIPYIVRV